jgi:hypothetical protein
VPDTFDRLGVFGVARASRLQRVRRRRGAPSPGAIVERRDAGRTAGSVPDPRVDRCPGDVAIDFVDMAAIVARMRSAFFADEP